VAQRVTRLTQLWPMKAIKRTLTSPWPWEVEIHQKRIEAPSRSSWAPNCTQVSTQSQLIDKCEASWVAASSVWPKICNDMG